MKVTVTTFTADDFGFEMDMGVEITTQKSRINCYDLTECPEDATLYRDLSFVYSIPDMLEEAYEAGKNGEDFTIEYIKGE